MIVPDFKSNILINGYFISIFCIVLLAGCASNKRVADRRSKPHKHRNERAYRSERNYTHRDRVPAVSKNHEPESQVDKVISIARSYTGVPYRWGGTTRSGMDCSGLLMTCFNEADLNIPRTTAEQVKFGRGVRLYELQPGDLVFFAAQKGNPNKVTHVGMVTEVRDKHDVRFIHASTKLGVVENNIYTDYYRKIFIKARRPF
jgi:probable lipoprotein NlpC